MTIFHFIIAVTISRKDEDHRHGYEYQTIIVKKSFLADSFETAGTISLGKAILDVATRFPGWGFVTHAIIEDEGISENPS